LVAFRKGLFDNISCKVTANFSAQCRFGIILFAISFQFGNFSQTVTFTNFSCRTAEKVFNLSKIGDSVLVAAGQYYELFYQNSYFHFFTRQVLVSFVINHF
jgi:hypothetical protein